MKNTTSRVLIETIVRKTLKDIKDSPERSTRNLVDMALHFSKGRFQTEFLRIAQTMLQNENSPYYKLIQDTVIHADTEKILRFGINLGYNGCSMGAIKIRMTKQLEQLCIPWTLGLFLSPRTFASDPKRYQATISQGEDLGIFTWFLFFTDGLDEEMLALAAEHPDSAFILLCKPEDITLSLVESAYTLDNLMFAVRLGDHARRACDLLHSSGLLHSVYFPYSPETLETITSGELFCTAEQLHPAFTALLPARGCPQAARDKVYEYVLHARNEQLFRTFPWDLHCDTKRVDEIISGNRCLAYFDSNGQFCTVDGTARMPVCNLFTSDLQEILRIAFGKEQETFSPDPTAGLA